MTGCTSSSYRIQPRPPDVVTWENTDLVISEVYVRSEKSCATGKNFATLFAQSLETNLFAALRHEYALAHSTQGLSPHYRCVVDLTTRVEAPGKLWIFPTVFTLTLVPLMVNVDEKVWGQIRVYEASGKTPIMVCPIPEYNSKTRHSWSITPLGFCAKRKDADFESSCWCAYSGEEYMNLEAWVNQPQPMLLRVVMSEINKLPLPAKAQP